MSGGGGTGLVLNLTRPGGNQSFFTTQRKRERDDAPIVTIKRPKVTHKAAPRLLKPSTPKTPPEKKSEGKEPAPAPAPAPAPEPPLNKEDAPTNEEKREIVTSLFMGNPAIPYIPKSNVTRLSEKVFSEEAFSSQDLAPHIVSNLEKIGLTSMTTVQQQAIPSILAGRDALVKSQTGSGKTLTYALPIIHSLMKQVPKVQRSDGVLALVVVPTRELALQSYQWFEKLHKSCVWVVPGYLIGGEKKKAEKARLRRGINILVGTPGRLIDHLHTTKSLTLAAVKFLVIDEADRLLDMGYERSITSIIETLQEHQPGIERKRQTIMLSATLSAGVEKLAGMSLHDPKVVDVSCSVGEGGGGDGTGEGAQLLTSEALATPANLSHHYLIVPAKLRLVTLAAFILSKCRFGDERKMIIFFATQDMVDYHTALFSKVLSRYGQEEESKTSLVKRAEKVLAGQEDDGEGSHDEEDVEDEEEEEKREEEAKKGDAILFQKLHGSMTQQDRSAVFKSFKEASAGVLMCTDVASRGLDMPKVRWIVQFNAACTAADYVHRVGRTARVNAPGSALAFLAPGEASYITMLERHKITMMEVNMNGVLRNLLLRPDPNSRRGVKTVEEAATGLQLKVEKLLIQDYGFHDLARKAYVSFIRAYASYPKEVREMFNFKALHLGHYAKSMGLRDAPGTLGAAAAFRAKREMKERRERKEKKRKIQVMNQRCGNLPRTAGMSEFDSGLDSLPKMKTKKKTKTKMGKTRLKR
ncbi:probable ATP-dependent RNA helicase DDX31 isoform X2 [Eriocheir sinensis]|uniref:probable ATP-dependent RNA helicase DDX31 isoform X2 n=1 Tax=Eriocheir sinensis TaxID=95602 RepID=UPI0021C6B4E9|nr:probable ATP-dependent RNA helicase DDX31 isoform X2 [Eriocheir sinensis]